MLTLDRQGSATKVSAHSYVSGKIRYYDLAVKAEPDVRLRQTIREALSAVGTLAVVRLTITGTASPEDYRDRYTIYDELSGELLSFEPVDAGLSEQITVEQIRAEFAEIGFAASLLEGLMDDPKEVQMAYGLLNECRE